MNKRILLLFAAIISLLAIKAQECDFYYPENEGAELVYKNFDKKGKLSGTNTQKVTKYSKTATGAEATIHVKSTDEKGKDAFESDLNVKCENGIFYFDMESYVNQQSLKGMEGMEFVVEHENLEMPSSLKVGDKLKDGWIRIKISTGAMVIMSMEVTISDRLVEKKESITTEAGTFDCYKINQTVRSKMPMKIETKSSEWLSKGSGIIKSENYSSDGSITSSMVLSAINK